jgi:hypothetical protein
VAKELREWLGKVGTGTLYIESGSPWENGYSESFNKYRILIGHHRFVSERALWRRVI